ncbi:MAG: helix-turn-helix transcriptional regulator [Treponema sp.]|nr:helix-turn-helix transcriptional regulator [Treponema sp.]MCL2251993.1 helix-turn-helix transcriptional regulator [Treponema sp.]
MNTVNLIIWIFVYSVCLVHIALFAVIYAKHKHKIELFYLIVLITMFLLAVLIMLSLVLDLRNIFPIIINSILLLYITVPLCGYYLFGVNKKYYILIPILIIIEAVIENVLMINNIFLFLYLSRIIFYILLLVPVFLDKKKNEKNSLKRIIQSVTQKTVLIFLGFMIIFIPFSLYLFEISYISSIWWAVFTLSYQIPGLVYCKNYLLIAGNEHKEQGKASEKGISSLSKRENEVALAICSGLTYAEIAAKLFISLSAVKKHAYSIYKKLEIKNNRELMHIVMEAQTPFVQKNTSSDESVQ